jgi:hypothetical protein
MRPTEAAPPTPSIIHHARALGHEAHTVAFALSLVTKQPWQSLCCWCLERGDPEEQREAYRLPKGGECCGCPRVGVDVQVVGP